MTVSHDDLHRSLGRVEGKQDAMKDRMDQLEDVVEKGLDAVAKSLESINMRLAKIETREAERRGAWAVLVAVSSFISGIIAAMATWWLKGGSS